MINVSIHKIILVLSTDYFYKKIFDGLDFKIRDLCRLIVLEIVDGGDNYYLSANFSPSHLLHLEKNFFDEVSFLSDRYQKNIINGLYLSLNTNFQKKLSNKERCQIEEIISNINEDIYFSVIENNKDSELYYQYIDYLINNEYRNISEYDWLKSKSDWDRFIISIMEDTPSSILDYYEEMTTPPLFKLFFFGLVIDKITKKKYFNSLIDDCILDSSKYYPNVILYFQKYCKHYDKF